MRLNKNKYILKLKHLIQNFYFKYTIFFNYFF